MFYDKPLIESRLRGNPMASLFALATAAALKPGCSVESGSTATVDLASARESLERSLESWKKGATIDCLRLASPPIVVQDSDWMLGQTLVGFEVTGDGNVVHANFRIPARLTLRSSQGNEVSKTVSYVVQTNPEITVFRDPA